MAMLCAVSVLCLRILIRLGCCKNICPFYTSSAEGPHSGQEEQYSSILSSLSSDISDVKQKVEEDVASKEDITRLEKKMDELKEGQREPDAKSKNSGIS